MQRIIGFPPVWDQNTRILILGSMPSTVSLALTAYYGHRQNAFWPILTRLLNMPKDAPYKERLMLMSAAGIGLWDVVHSCVREGSSDASIAQSVPNELTRAVSECPYLHAIAFNGKAAEKLFYKYFSPEDFASAVFISLPSTSPANAMLSREQKYAIWRDALSPYIIT